MDQDSQYTGRPLRVVISNAYGDDNRGSAALNAAAILTAMKLGPNVEVHIVSVMPARTMAESFRHTMAAFPDIHLHAPPIPYSERWLGGVRTAIQQAMLLLLPKRRQLPSALAAIRGADLVVSRGGYVLYGRGSLRGNLALFSSLFPVLYAQRVGKPRATMPTSIGPLGSRRFDRLVLGYILRRSGTVIARDPKSKSAARELGVHESCLVETPDSVFLLSWPLARPDSREYAVVTERTASRTLLPATELLAHVGNVLLETGAVKNIIGAPQVHGMYSDVAATAAVISRISSRYPGRAELIETDLSVEELLAVYSSATVTISHHLHACVLSMITGTPAVAISTDGAKIEGLYESLGLPASWVVRPNSDPDAVVATVVDAMGRSKDVVAAVSRARRILEVELAEKLTAAIREGS